MNLRSYRVPLVGHFNAEPAHVPTINRIIHRHYEAGTEDHLTIAGMDLCVGFQPLAGWKCVTDYQGYYPIIKLPEEVEKVELRALLGNRPAFRDLPLEALREIVSLLRVDVNH